MLARDFYLLVENSYESCYLTARFIEHFKHSSHFRGVLVAEDQPEQDILQQRQLFHSEYGGQKNWNNEMEKSWLGLYQPLNKASRMMIQLYGVAKFAVTQHPNTIFLGHEVNGSFAQNCLSDICRKTTPWLVTYLPTILNSWWIEIAQSQILNCHSAVLPYARGMHAIENIASQKNINAFQQAAGITIHYIDSGIDTGSIIRAERVTDPFRFNSIWELKACLYMTGVEHYIRTVRDIIDLTSTIPVGIRPSADLYGKNHLRKHFTPLKRQQAEEGYLWMKTQVKNEQQKPVSDNSAKSSAKSSANSSTNSSANTADPDNQASA